MSALRYSGQVRVRVTALREPMNGSWIYRCALRVIESDTYLPCTVTVIGDDADTTPMHPIAVDTAAWRALRRARYQGWTGAREARWSDGGPLLLRPAEWIPAPREKVTNE